MMVVGFISVGYVGYTFLNHNSTNQRQQDGVWIQDVKYTTQGRTLMMMGK
jgi:hypothetical protein